MTATAINAGIIGWQGYEIAKPLHLDARLHAAETVGVTRLRRGAEADSDVGPKMSGGRVRDEVRWSDDVGRL
jgi:hypothetical protein